MRVFCVTLLVLSLTVPVFGEELRRVIPDVRECYIARHRCSYDMRSVDEATANDVAGYFMKAFGHQQYPTVYGIPDMKDLMLVSASGTQTEQDFGARFFLLQKDGDSFQELFRGRGAGDSYMLRPYFYVGNDTVLIFGEQGAEYTWGHSVHMIDKIMGTIKPLGHLHIAVQQEENTYTPFDTARVFVDDGTISIRIYADLVLDPGGMHERTLKKEGAFILIYYDGKHFMTNGMRLDRAGRDPLKK